MADVMKLSMVLSATDKMSRVIDQATKKSTATLTNFQKRANAIGGKMQKIGAGMAASGAAITGSLFAAVKEESKAASEYLRTSQKIGMSVENWQRVEYAADRTNVASESLRIAMQRMMKTQVTAAMGNKKAALSFKMAGISIMDQSGKLKASNRMMMDVADKFQKAPDGPKKTALAILLFGKAGADLIPMLNKGSKGINEFGDEAKKFGLIMSDTEARKMKAFALQTRHINDAMTGFKRVIAESALPVMTKLITKISNIHVKMIAFISRHRAAAKTIIELAGAFGIIMTVLGTFLLVSGTVIRTVGNFKKIMDLARIGMSLTKNSMILFKIQYYALAVAQKVATAGQWLLNSALLANPITWVVVGIAALTAAIVIAWKKFAWFRAGIKTAWDTVKGFGNILKEYVIDRIKGIISGLGSMGRAIGLLFKGKFAAAGKVAWSGVKDLSGITATQNAIKKSVVLVKNVPGTFNRHLAIEEAAQRAKDEPKSRAAVRSTQAYNSSNIQRANISNAPAIHYAPVIHLNGGSPTVKQDISKILNEHKTEIEQWLKKIFSKSKSLIL